MHDHMHLSTQSFRLIACDILVQGPRTVHFLPK